MKELYEIIQTRQSADQCPFALATVLHVEGSSYRRPGARMLVGVQGRVRGSVSGGCLERNVVAQAIEVIVQETPRLVTYDTHDPDDHQFGSSLGCEGTITILIEPLLPGQPWPLARTVDLVKLDRQPRVQLTCYQQQGPTGEVFHQSLTWTDGQPLPEFLEIEIPDKLQYQFRRDWQKVWSSGKTKTPQYGCGNSTWTILMERVSTPPPLFIFGAGPDAEPLCRLAAEMGYQIAVVDRRADRAQSVFFPLAERVLCLRPQLLPQRIEIPPDASVIVMNHHQETDRETLRFLLGRPLAYLGLLGPQKRAQKILQDLEADGLKWSPDDQSRLHAPAGLDLGAEEPDDIALSILAEIQMVRSGATGRSLRQRSTPIHAPEPIFVPGAVSPLSLVPR